MSRIIRIIIGLALIAYGVFSGNSWFYLGFIPLVTGVINWCPLEQKIGGCSSESGCCGSSCAGESKPTAETKPTWSTTPTQESCCSSESECCKNEK